MTKEIDLNCDLGESYSVYSYGMDKEIMPYIRSANIACGFHAGDPTVMRQTVELAHSHGVRIGAHVGFPDRLGFGRREMKISAEEAYDYILYQIGALSAFLTVKDIPLSHVKLHGAFYMMACHHEEIAKAAVEAVYAFDKNLELYTLPACTLAEQARMKGLQVIPEFFADRPYNQNRVRMFDWKKEELGTERDIAIRAKEAMLSNLNEDTELKTVCVHSDTPGSFDIIKALHHTFSNDNRFSLRKAHHLTKQPDSQLLYKA